MIHGAHVILYSKDAEADRAFFRDVLGYRFADAGSGWLIFALPPAEVAVHPADDNDRHELYLMCDDVNAVVDEMNAKGVACSAIQEERWGLITNATLPGGGTIGVYQPRHPTPLAEESARTKADVANSGRKRTLPDRKKAAATARSRSAGSRERARPNAKTPRATKIRVAKSAAGSARKTKKGKRRA